MKMDHYDNFKTKWSRAFKHKNQDNKYGNFEKLYLYLMMELY